MEVKRSGENLESCKQDLAALEADTGTAPMELVKLRRDATDRLEACQITHDRESSALSGARASLLSMVKDALAETRRELNRLASEHEGRVKAIIASAIGEERAREFMAKKEVESLAAKAEGVADRRSIATQMGGMNNLGQLDASGIGNAISLLGKSLGFLNPETTTEQP